MNHLRGETNTQFICIAFIVFSIDQYDNLIFKWNDNRGFEWLSYLKNIQ